MPAKIPSPPNATASTSGGAGSEVNTTAAASATCRGVSAHWAPAWEMGRGGLAANIVDDQGITRPLETRGHPGAYRPQADEAHFYVGVHPSDSHSRLARFL